MNVVLMGVAGCGKTTLGQLLATQTGGTFFDADAFHPPANVAKMARGEPLTDTDRVPWLDKLASLLHEKAAPAHTQTPSAPAAPPVFLACSALRRSYRDRLRNATTGDPSVIFLWLHGAPELLAARLSARKGHYMPATMLASQLATLEPPTPDETALVLDIAQPPGTQARSARAWLGI